MTYTLYNRLDCKLVTWYSLEEFLADVRRGYMLADGDRIEVREEAR